MGCCCGKRNDAGNAKKGGDPAVDRIQSKFLAAFDQTFAVEDSIRTFLQTDIFPVYEPVFKSNALAERAASSKKDDKKKKKGEVEVTKMPTEPTDSKDTKKGQMLWEKYAADKKAYEAWALGKARRAELVVGAQVAYPEDLLYLQPISDKTGKPYKVIISKLPEDPSKAMWSDELKQITGQSLDAKVRKDKAVMPKIKGVAERCFEASKDDIVTRLMALTRSDAAIWEGCAPKTKPKKGEPKEPKAPPDLVNPAEMFKEGKNAGKYEEFDDEGVPKKKVTKQGADDLKDGEMQALKKQWEKAKAVWDKHQAAMQTYKDEMKRLRGDVESGEDDFGVPEEQKQQSCKAAAQAIVAKLVEEQIVKRSEELAAEVNNQKHDSDSPLLAEIIVQETLEDVEIITDPVLKAFRHFDEEATDSCRADQLKGFFRKLGEDELHAGTHAFYNEVSDAELDWTRGKLAEVGVEQDGNMTVNGIKTFMEATEVSVLAGKVPTNLVGCLMTMKIENRLSGLKKMEVMWSPRTWRSKLTEEFGSPGGVSPRGSTSNRGSTSGSTSARKSKAKGKDDGKKSKADGEDEPDQSGSPKDKRSSTVKAKDSEKSSDKDRSSTSKRASESKKDKKEDKDDKKEKKDRSSKKK